MQSTYFYHQLGGFDFCCSALNLKLKTLKVISCSDKQLSICIITLPKCSWLCTLFGRNNCQHLSNMGNLISSIYEIALKSFEF